MSNANCPSSTEENQSVQVQEISKHILPKPDKKPLLK